MKEYGRKVICFFLTIVFMVACFTPIHADKDRNFHDKWLEKVLFGRENYKLSQSKDIKNKIMALEYASYLALDQYNSAGQKEIDFLKQNGVWGVPKLSDIDFPMNNYHRRYTHRGWDFSYDDDKANWEKRKKILLNTVNKVFGFGFLSSGLQLGDKYDKRCESFAALIYYIHVLADIFENENEKYTTFNQYGMIYLAQRNDPDNSLIAELKKHLAVLFEDQENSRNSIIHMIEKTEVKAYKIIHSDGGINSDEKLQNYKELAKELMESLGNTVPQLLEKEEFFMKAFK